MNKEKGRVPKLRFPGFTEDWEQRKVNEIFKVTRGQVLAASFTTPEKNRGNIYPVYSSQTKDNGLLGYYSEYLFENAITWTTDGANAGTVNFRPGRFYSTNVNGVLINENGYACYAVSEIINKVAYKYVSKVGNPKLMNNVMAEINIMITPDIDELKQISKLIEAYNQYITLHQRKLEHLNLKKKALLQKLFPKNGERYPELRFLGFTNAWEQRKLGDIVDFLDGQRKPLKESERTKGKYPYYGASGIIDYISDYLFDENLVLLSEDGANIIDRNYPVCFIATGQYWVNNHAHVLKVKTGIIDKFICESLERLDYTKFNTGTAQPKLNQDICQKIVITIPNEDEQKYISEFLDRINNIITLHQRKLEHLQLQKKALLQQMFV